MLKLVEAINWNHKSKYATFATLLQATRSISQVVLSLGNRGFIDFINNQGEGTLANN